MKPKPWHINKNFDIIDMRKQAHYRAREGEWKQLFVEPEYMCAGGYIKPLLVQCALYAIRKKSNPEIRKRYLNLKNMRTLNKKQRIFVAFSNSESTDF